MAYDPDLEPIFAELHASIEANAAQTAEVIGDLIDLLQAMDARLVALENGTVTPPAAIEFRKPADFAASDLRENTNPTGPYTLTDPALIEHHADGTATLHAEQRLGQPVSGKTYYSGSLVTRTPLHFAKGLFGGIVHLKGRTVGALFAYGGSGKEIDFEATYLLGEAAWSPNLWLPKQGGGRYSAGSTASRIFRRAPVTAAPQVLLARLLDDRCEFFYQNLNADLTPAGPLFLFETITPADFPADVIWDVTTKDLAIFTALELHAAWAGWTAADYAQPASMRVYGITPGSVDATLNAEVVPNDPLVLDAAARTINGGAWVFGSANGGRSGFLPDGKTIAMSSNGTGTATGRVTFPVEPGKRHRLSFSIRGKQISVNGGGASWAGYGSGNYVREWVPTASSETVTFSAGSRTPDYLGAVTMEMIDVVTPPVSSGLQVGINNSGINYFAREWPWLNILKSCSAWIGQGPNGWNSVSTAGHLDANGWPLRMPPGATSLDMLLPWEQLMNEPAGTVSPMAGTYRLRYEGQGTVQINGQMIPNNGTVNLSMGAGGGPILSLRATTDGNPVRNMSLVKTDKTARFDAGETFDPDYLDVMRPFSAVRHLGWGATNFSTQSAWGNRPTPADYTYEWRGAPLEEIVAFHNAVQSDMWLTIPHLATPDFETRTATYIRDNLAPGLKAYIEKTNEGWNEAGPWQSATGQTKWLKDEATRLWGDWLRWNQAYGKLAAETMRRFAAVFTGADAARFVPVISGHPANEQFFDEAMRAPLWTNTADGGKRPYQYAKAVGLNGYFARSLGYEDAPAILGWIADHGQAEALTRTFALLEGQWSGYRASIKRQVAKAREYGLKPVIYEGGSHADGRDQFQANDTLTNFLNVLHRDPRMGAAYTRMLAIAEEEGIELFCAFESIKRHDKFGPWGTRTTRNVTTPRWDALVNWA